MKHLTPCSLADTEDEALVNVARAAALFAFVLTIALVLFRVTTCACG